MGSYGLDWSGRGWGQVMGLCVHGNKPLGSIKCRKFLDSDELLVS